MVRCFVWARLLMLLSWLLLVLLASRPTKGRIVEELAKNDDATAQRRAADAASDDDKEAAIATRQRSCSHLRMTRPIPKNWERRRRLWRRWWHSYKLTLMETLMLLIKRSGICTEKLICTSEPNGSILPQHSLINTLLLAQGHLCPNNLQLIRVTISVNL